MPAEGRAFPRALEVELVREEPDPLASDQAPHGLHHARVVHQPFEAGIQVMERLDHSNRPCAGLVFQLDRRAALAHHRFDVHVPIDGVAIMVVAHGLLGAGHHALCSHAELRHLL
jgi:hypothetical protein